jgi:hypothetical protein
MMEGSSPASYEIGTPNRVSRAQSNWARMMQTLALFWEANRMNFVLLAKAEMNTKVSRVSALKNLNHEGHQVGRCLHPPTMKVSRSNQYACWTVCGACSARISYRSKRASQGRVRGAPTMSSSAAMASAYPAPEEAVPATPRQPRSAPSTTHGNAEEILQQALQTFNLQNSQFGQMMAQVQRSLQELAQGQAQMVMIMQSPSTVSARSQMEEDQWSVAEAEMQNPNDGQDM